MVYGLAFLAIVILIVVHEAGHFWMARACKMKVERFSIFFGPPIAKFVRNGTTYQIGTIPLGGFVQITGMNPMEEHDENDPHIYPNRPAWQRFLTIVAGPLMNYATAVVLVFGIFAVWGVPRAAMQQQVGEVNPASAAAQAGVEVGDQLISVDGQAADHEHPATAILDRAAGRSVEVVVRRGGAEKRLQVTALKDSEGHYRMGVALVQLEEYQPVGILTAAHASLVFPVVRSLDILRSLGEMVRGKVKLDDVHGLTEITGQLGKAIKRGARDSLGMIVNLSIFLGLFNLLPIPALDGGRLAFLCYEIVSRRRVNQRIEAGIHMVFAILLFGVMMLVIFKDVRKQLGW